MTAFGGGFPTGAIPGAVAQGGGAGLVINIPADPNWEPFDTTDTLEMDGYYCARIKQEKARTGDGSQKAGVFLTLELGDPDALGKILSKFMLDPTTTAKDTWWTWRSLMRSIIGNTDGGKAAFQYTPGAFAGKICYLRTGAYTDNDGTTRTGVDAFVTQSEWQEAVTQKKHRWPARAKSGGGPAGSVGALPTGGGGLSAAFPGAGSGGLPGAPAAPMGFPASAGSAPAPTAAAPMQAPPAPTGFPPTAAPAAQAPAGFPVAAPPAVAQAGFAFPPAPAVAAAQNGAPAPQPAGNGFPAFPGT